MFLGVNSPEAPRDDYTSRLRAALLDADKDVRDAAIVAVGYAGWRLFRPEIEQMAAADPDADARERAKRLLDDWAKQDRDA